LELKTKEKKEKKKEIFICLRLSERLRVELKEQIFFLKNIFNKPVFKLNFFVLGSSFDLV
jgi:hypothetical protein